MKTEWDYSALADAYLKRPDYAPSAIDGLIQLTGISRNDPVCDVGAGVAHLTLELARRGLQVTAVEPNDAMRANGIKRTTAMHNVNWVEGTGEVTHQDSGRFKLVTFGSSFNVTQRQLALMETARILQTAGWFACLWNHRDLNDPIQAEIENLIGQNIKNYQYGSRREDQTDIINASQLFGTVSKITGAVSFDQPLTDCIEAWRSHATLQRQAGELFPTVVNKIAGFLESLHKTTIRIPYTTHIWTAQKKQP